jgi:hypothetical protein
MTHQIAARHFDPATLAGLRAAGIRIIGTTMVPGPDGSFADGETVYKIDDNGTHRVRTHRELRALAGRA